MCGVHGFDSIHIANTLVYGDVFWVFDLYFTTVLYLLLWNPHFLSGDEYSIILPYPLSSSLSQNSTVTIEEFHSRLQEATNFPLRPFVIPFLKVNVCYVFLSAVPTFYITTVFTDGSEAS